MMPPTSEPTLITRTDALTIWAAARERAADELALKADRMTREAHWDAAAGLRTAARLLRQRAVQERAQAAACRADKTDGPRVTGGCGQSAWSSDQRAEHACDCRHLGGRGRL